MSFLEAVQRARDHLERQGRVSLRALQREFGLDAAALEELVAELVDVQQVAALEGKLLSWVGPASLQGRLAALETPGPQPPTTQGEHRQLTVMFCDLLDSTQHAGRLEPEDWFGVVRSYQATAAEVVAGFDGHVAEYHGDGIVVYFGYPKAHEDDAERAVRAGLGIVEAIRERNAEIEQQYGVALELRLGIHTGRVVLGEMGEGDKREILALGDTTHIAARVQAIAEPQSLLVTAETLRLVRGIFVTEDRGSHELKGVGPVSLHRVVQASGVRSRLDLAGEPLTRTVGREDELAMLRDRWEQARAGDGQVVFIVGEAGVGKSRLMSAFRSELVDVPHTWVDAQCSTFRSGVAFAPLLDLASRGLGLEQLGSAQEKLAALEAIRLPRLAPAQFVPYLAEMLSLPPSPRHPLPQTSPELQRERTLELLAAMVLELAELQPMAFCIEDLQWCDPSTLEVVARLVERARDASILLLFTARPHEAPEWVHAHRHVSLATLSVLEDARARELVTGMLEGRSLPEPLLHGIVQRADGVPLFLEELTRSVLASGSVVARGDRYELTGATAELEVPRTLQDSLTARLDQLSSAKQVAQLAATIGRSFSYELIEALGELDVPTLWDGLERLVDAEILYQRGEPPEASYSFKHALLQDTAYASQLRTVRRARHARIADALEERFPERVEAEPETLAHHCAEGGLHERAARGFEAAGQRAFKQIANEEAVSHFRRGLEQLALVEEGPDRHQLEISLRAGLGGPLSWLSGHDAPEVVATYARVRELADLVGEGPQQLAAWLGLVTYYTQTASMSSMRDLGYAILRSAEPLDAKPLTAVGHLLVGNSQNSLGPISVAAEHLEKVVELGEAGCLPPPASAQEIDMLVVAKASLGIAYLHLGSPARTFALQREAVARARALDHANSLVIALILCSVGAYQASAPELARSAVAEGVRVARERGFRSQASHLALYAGWLRVVDGDPGGADEVLAALDDYRHSGSTTLVAWLCCVAGGVLQLAGRGEEALRYLRHMDETIEHTGEWNFRPRAYLTRACVHLDAGREDEAEAWLSRGLDAAREAESCNEALALGVTLAPLWSRRGRGPEARALLASAYRPLEHGAAGGPDLPLLRAARAALAELGAQAGGASST